MSEIERGEAVRELVDMSLLIHSSIEAAVSVHRLVQEVMRGLLIEAGELSQMAATATWLVAQAYDSSESHEAAARNNTLLPHAQAVLAYAPKGGPATIYTVIVSNRVGEALIDLYELAEALTTYRTALRIAERLVNSYPRNSLCLEALAETQSGMGDVHADRGERDDALTLFEAALATLKELVKMDKSVQRQRALALIYVRIAGVCEQSERASNLQIGRAIIADLMRKSPDDATLASELDLIDGMIASLKKTAFKARSLS
jgi:tetratricopeptide (TPR) repeat protein